MRKILFFIAIAAVLLFVFGWLLHAISYLLAPTSANEITELEAEDIIELPEPRRRSDVSVEEAIYSRRSTRSYADRPLTLPETAQVLWAAVGRTVNGVTGATRAYPSAGGIYPLTVYLVAGEVEGLEPGVYRYDWQRHGLQPVAGGDRRAALARAALGQGAIQRAPASLVFTGDFARTRRRYGSRGEERYVPMDMGGAGQNVHLQAEALELATVVIGAFNDSGVREVIAGAEGEPLYIMPLGGKP